MKRCCSYVLSQLGVPLFFSFWLLVPSLSWNTLRSTTAFVSIHDGCYSESFGLVSLDQELFRVSFSAGWAGTPHSSWLPLQALPITIFLPSASGLNLKWQETETEGFILQRKGINSECMLVPKRDLRERSALQVYLRVFQGLKVETENFIKNISIFYLN